VLLDTTSREAQAAQSTADESYQESLSIYTESESIRVTEVNVDVLNADSNQIKSEVLYAASSDCVECVTCGLLQSVKSTSVSLSVTRAGRANLAEWIDVMYGIEILYYMGASIPRGEGEGVRCGLCQITLAICSFLWR